MAIKLIWCQDASKGIGINNKLPWNIPEELKHFKETTLHQTIVMGRKTFESLKQPLPYRRNIILTRNLNYFTEHNDVVICNKIQDVIKNYSSQDIFVIGGKEIYETFFEIADELIVTKLFDLYDCDTFLNFDLQAFHQYHKEVYEKFEIYYYSRIKPLNQLNFQLKNFRGSLDLLWSLIKEKKYNLLNLDISNLTEQYLNYISSAINTVDIDLASEYLITATELIELKMKLVFAQSETATEDDLNTFLLEKDLLIQRLLEYKKIKKGITWLRKKQEQRILHFEKKVEPLDIYIDTNLKEEYLPKSIDTEKLKRSYMDALIKCRMRNLKTMQLKIKEVSIELVEKDFKIFIERLGIIKFNYYDYLSQIPLHQKNLKYFVLVFLVILNLVKYGELIILEKDNEIIFEKTQNWKSIYEQEKQTTPNE